MACCWLLKHCHTTLTVAPPYFFFFWFTSCAKAPQRNNTRMLARCDRPPPPATLPSPPPRSYRRHQTFSGRILVHHHYRQQECKSSHTFSSARVPICPVLKRDPNATSLYPPPFCPRRDLVCQRGSFDHLSAGPVGSISPHRKAPGHVEGRDRGS